MIRRPTLAMRGLRRSAVAWGWVAIVACKASGSANSQDPDGGQLGDGGGILGAGATVDATVGASGISTTNEPVGPAWAVAANEAGLWQRAKGDDDADLARLADAVGAAGLIEGAQLDPTRRVVAVKSMAFSHGFYGLPWLAAAAATASNDSDAALESVATLASARRTQEDPEDAQELHDGCVALVALAQNDKLSKQRRSAAVSSLRMLAERGGIAIAQIPTDSPTTGD